MPSTEPMPSGLVIVTSERDTLVRVLDALAPAFEEPGPRILREQDGTWRRMILIPDRWCVHAHGPIATEVRQAGRLAYGLGATEVLIVTHELTTRRLRRLTSVSAE